MNNAIINYEYKGSKISFEKGNNVMVNATEMAKPFSKRPNDYLNLPSTLELIDAITRKSGISENQIVMIKQGAPQYGGGTWLHEDLALDFAQWLSVDFRLWCNDRIKELLTQGVATISDGDEVIAKAMEVLQYRLNESKRRVQMLEGENENQRKQLQIQAPKIEYVDKVLQSTSTYSTTLIAKELGMGAVTLNKKLREMGVQYKQGGTWVLTYKYQNKGYTETRTHVFTRSDGSQGTEMQTVWTERGREFIINLLKRA